LKVTSPRCWLPWRAIPRRRALETCCSCAGESGKRRSARIGRRPVPTDLVLAM
jgi:hypothetical protein